MADAIAAMRREGQQLIARGQALLDRAANLEADAALGGDLDDGPLPSGAGNGLSATARSMAEGAWITSQMLAERTNREPRIAASCLSRLAAAGELETRKQAGFPAMYRRIGT